MFKIKMNVWNNRKEANAAGGSFSERIGSRAAKAGALDQVHRLASKLLFCVTLM